MDSTRKMPQLSERAFTGSLVGDPDAILDAVKFVTD